MTEPFPTDGRDEKMVDESKQHLLQATEAAKNKEWDQVQKHVGLAWLQFNEAYKNNVPAADADKFIEVLKKLNATYIPDSVSIVDEIMNAYKRTITTTEKEQRVYMTSGLLSLAYQALHGNWKTAPAFGVGLASRRAQDAMEQMVRSARSPEGAQELRRIYEETYKKIEVLNDEIEKKK